MDFHAQKDRELRRLLPYRVSKARDQTSQGGQSEGTLFHFLSLFFWCRTSDLYPLSDLYARFRLAGDRHYETVTLWHVYGEPILSFSVVPSGTSDIETPLSDLHARFWLAGGRHYETITCMARVVYGEPILASSVVSSIVPMVAF